MTHRFSHLDPLGRARMVDVTVKEPTHRRAIARARINMLAETASAVARGAIGKGDVLAVARVAGIQAAKRAPDLIPLCHPIVLTNATVDLEMDTSLPGVRVTASASTVAKTGVEMEALTAAAVTLLTIYDMAKALDRRMEISSVRLLEKRGGKSGVWKRD